MKNMNLIRAIATTVVAQLPAAQCQEASLLALAKGYVNQLETRQLSVQECEDICRLAVLVEQMIKNGSIDDELVRLMQLTAHNAPRRVRDLHKSEAGQQSRPELIWALTQLASDGAVEHNPYEERELLRLTADIEQRISGNNRYYQDGQYEPPQHMKYKFVKATDKYELDGLTAQIIDQAATKLATTLIQYAGVYKAIGGLINTFPLKFRVLQTALTESALLDAARGAAEGEEIPEEGRWPWTPRGAIKQVALVLKGIIRGEHGILMLRHKIDGTSEGVNTLISSMAKYQSDNPETMISTAGNPPINPEETGGGST
jgi:hypothetical protein